MADPPIYRRDPITDDLQFIWSDAEIIIASNQEPDRIGRIQVQINPAGSPQGRVLAADLIDWRSDTERSRLARQAAMRDGIDAEDWANRLLSVSIKLIEVAPNLVRAIRNRHLVYIPNDDYELAFSMSSYPEPPPLSFLIEGRLPIGYPTILYGEGGNFKSYLALYISLCVASGLPCWGANVKKVPVAYLDYELDAAETLRRSYKLARGLGFKCPPGNLYYIRGTRNLVDSMDQVDAYLRDHEIGLLVVDSLGPAAGGDPESAAAMITLFNALRGVSATPLLIDHQSKQQTGDRYATKTPFGSVYKGNLSRSIYQARRISDDHDLQRSGVMLRHAKANFTAREDDLALSITWGDSITVEVATPGDREVFRNMMGAATRIQEKLAQLGKSTYPELAEATGLTEGTVKNTVNVMKREGKVSEVGKRGRQKLFSLLDNVAYEGH